MPGTWRQWTMVDQMQYNIIKHKKAFFTTFPNTIRVENMTYHRVFLMNFEVLQIGLNWSQAYSNMVMISSFQLDELLMSWHFARTFVLFHPQADREFKVISVLICLISIIYCALLLQLPKTSFIVTTSMVKCRIVQCTGRPSAAVRLTPIINPPSQRLVWRM